MWLRFPVVHIAQLLCGLIWLASFFATISFLVALPVVHGKVGTSSAPASWEAAVPNHGKYYQWFLIDDHLMFFFVVIAVAALSFAASVALAKICKASQQTDKLHHPIAYRVADAATAVAGLAIVLLFVHRL